MQSIAVENSVFICNSPTVPDNGAVPGGEEAKQWKGWVDDDDNQAPQSWDRLDIGF